jgi:hypothetical protein
MAKISGNSIQLGDSATATNNFVLQTALDGTAKLSRGNVGATTQDVLTVGADGLINTTKQLTLGTVQNTTSGTSIDFTGIPSWAKRITVMLNGVSTNGSSSLLVQIGAGVIQASGYSGVGYVVASASLASVQLSVGLNLDANGSSATYFKQGFVIFNVVAGNVWSFGGLVSQSDSLRTNNVSGTVSLAGTLDRLRLTTVNGTDLFDAGLVNILYEG